MVLWRAILFPEAINLTTDTWTCSIAHKWKDFTACLLVTYNDHLSSSMVCMSGSKGIDSGALLSTPTPASGCLLCFVTSPGRTGAGVSFGTTLLSRRAAWVRDGAMNASFFRSFGGWTGRGFTGGGRFSLFSSTTETGLAKFKRLVQLSFTPLSSTYLLITKRRTESVLSEPLWQTKHMFQGDDRRHTPL